MPDRGADPGARESLAAAQADLLAALVAGGPIPEGFDVARVRIQAHSLMAKRRGSVARVLPGLVRALGGTFAKEFAAYAEGRPKPAGGSRADARAFLDWLGSEGRLPDRPAPVVGGAGTSRRPR
ncbi:hypothetical protein N5079_15635 [Planotetraspora sp. A-T 1434]|uniref:hypothetical protein n=1 Tax=Planotetraspora sp. A-T 1434 TaxID=2979219 RepID=UPI0021C040E7|nr:hypothetical protein [Planotetraspora sp. A-T 1434]MCT9931645.1 hypothetical protein [Planotetraspora sp. A-T 1434]